MWPAAKRQERKKSRSAVGHDPISVDEVSAEPWPDVARSQERETKAKRMRPPSLNDQRTPLSRGPSGLPRSGKSGKNWAGLGLSQREITAGSNPIDARSLRISLS